MSALKPIANDNDAVCQLLAMQQLKMRAELLSKECAVPAQPTDASDSLFNAIITKSACTMSAQLE